MLTTPHRKNVSCYEIFKQEFKKPLTPEPSAILAELVIKKLKKGHKSQGIDQIPAELIKAGGITIC
jgi:hypothetical protein